MAKKISEIYYEYKIIPSLQEHMLRVAAVASFICDNFSEPLAKEDIITACLLHDMGNIVKFNMNLLLEFFEPEGIEYWQKVKEKYITKYGSNDHETNLKIIKELGFSGDILSLVDQNRFSFLCQHRDSSDMKAKIMHYADGRVDPHGVVSYDKRMLEAKKRYRESAFGAEEEERQKLVACGKEIEKQIFSKCKIRPEDINDEMVKPIILSLKDFVIKVH